MNAQVKAFKYASYIFPKFMAQKAIRLFLTPDKVPRPKSEQEWYDSAKKYTINGKYAAYEWGDANDPIVLLIHGWGGRGTQMGAFAKPLVVAGHRVIALDGPTHGDSLGSETNAGEFSRFLVEVQKIFGTVKGAVGHSFGAGCLVLASTFGMELSKMVLISSPSDYGKVISEFLDYVGMSPGAEKNFYKILKKIAHTSFDELKLYKIGENIKSEIFIIHDKKDKEVNFSSAMEMHQAWPRSHLLSTEGLGHRRILKDPEVIKQVVEFMSTSMSV